MPAIPIVVQIIAGLAAMKGLDYALPTRESVLAKKRETLARKQVTAQDLAKSILANRETTRSQIDAIGADGVNMQGVQQILDAIGGSSAFGTASDDGTGMSIESPLRASGEGTTAITSDQDVEGVMSAIASLTAPDRMQSKGSGLLSRMAAIREAHG